jgi:hypothetical protein
MNRYYIIIVLSAGVVNGDRHYPLLHHPVFFFAYPDTWNSPAQLFSLFFNLQTFMEKKPPANEPVEKTNKCSLYSAKESEQNGYGNNDWPKPESRSFECRTHLQQVMRILVI